MSDGVRVLRFVVKFPNVTAPDNCKECPTILSELEKIDDESDDHGVVFVTTDDTKLARKAAGINKLPAIVLFRNGLPMVYKGEHAQTSPNDKS